MLLVGRYILLVFWIIIQVTSMSPKRGFNMGSGIFIQDCSSTNDDHLIQLYEGNNIHSNYCTFKTNHYYQEVFTNPGFINEDFNVLEVGVIYDEKQSSNVFVNGEVFDQITSDKFITSAKDIEIDVKKYSRPRELVEKRIPIRSSHLENEIESCSEDARLSITECDTFFVQDNDSGISMKSPIDSQSNSSTHKVLRCKRETNSKMLQKKGKIFSKNRQHKTYCNIIWEYRLAEQNEIPLKNYQLNRKMMNENFIDFSGHYVLDIAFLGWGRYCIRVKQMGIFSPEMLACAENDRNVRSFCHDPHRSACNGYNPHCTLLSRMHMKERNCTAVKYRDETFFIMQSSCSLIIFECTEASYNEKRIPTKDKLLTYRTRVLLTIQRTSNLETTATKSIKKNREYRNKAKLYTQNETVTFTSETPNFFFGNETKTTVVSLKIGLTEAMLMLNQFGKSVSAESVLVSPIPSISRIQRRLKSLFPSLPSHPISMINSEETLGAGSKSFGPISRLSLIESRYKARSAAMPFTATVNRVTEASESDDFTTKEASTKWQTTRITDQYFRPLLRTEGSASARTIFPGREEIMLEIDEITVPEETETTANYSGRMTAELVAKSRTPEIKEFVLRDHKADRNLRAIVVKDVEYTSSPISDRTLNNGLPISKSDYQWPNSPGSRYGFAEKMENGDSRESRSMFGESANSSTKSEREYFNTKFGKISEERGATLILDEYAADDNVPEITNEEGQKEETSKESILSTTSESITSTFKRVLHNKRSIYFSNISIPSRNLSNISILNRTYSSDVNNVQTNNTSDVESTPRNGYSVQSKFQKFLLRSLNMTGFPESKSAFKNDVPIVNNEIPEGVTQDFLNYDLDDSTGKILPPCSQDNNYGKNTSLQKDYMCGLEPKLKMFEGNEGRNLSIKGKLFTLEPTSSKKSRDDIPVNISRSIPHVMKIENNQQWMVSEGEIRNWLSRKSFKPSGSFSKKDEGGDSIGTYVKLYFTKKLSVLKMLPTRRDFFCQHDNGGDFSKTDFVERKEEEWVERQVLKIHDCKCLLEKHYLSDDRREFGNTNNILHRLHRRTEIDRKIISRDMMLISLIESQRFNEKQKVTEGPGKKHFEVYHVFHGSKPFHDSSLNKVHRRGNQANVVSEKCFEKERNGRKILYSNLNTLNNWNRKGRRLLSVKDSDEIQTSRNLISDKLTDNARVGNEQFTHNDQKVNSGVSNIEQLVQTVPEFGGSGSTQINNFPTVKHTSQMNVRKKRSSDKFEDLGRKEKSLATRNYYLGNEDSFKDIKQNLKKRMTRKEHPNRRDILFKPNKNGRESYQVFRTNPHISMIKVIPIRLYGVLPLVRSNELPAQGKRKLNDGKTSLEKIYGSSYNRKADKSFSIQISPQQNDDEDEEKLLADSGNVLQNGHASSELSFNNVSNDPHESDSVLRQGSTEPSRTAGSIPKETNSPLRLSFATRKQMYRLSTENVTMIPSSRNNPGEQHTKNSEGYTSVVENEVYSNEKVTRSDGSNDIKAAGESAAKTSKNTDVGQLSSTEYSVVNMDDRTLTEFPDENQDTWKNIKPAAAAAVIFPSPAVTVLYGPAVCVERKPEYTKCEFIKAPDRDCSKGEKVHSSNILAMTECTKKLRRVVSVSEGQSNKVDEMAMHLEDIVFLPKPDKSLIEDQSVRNDDCKDSGMTGRQSAVINSVDIQKTQNSAAPSWNRRNAPNAKLHSHYELYDKQRTPFLWDNFSQGKTLEHNKRGERKAALRKKKKKRVKKTRRRGRKKERKNRNLAELSEKGWPRQRRHLLSVFEDGGILTSMSGNHMKYDSVNIPHKTKKQDTDSSKTYSDVKTQKCKCQQTQYETGLSGRFNEQIRAKNLQVNSDGGGRGSAAKSNLSGKLSAKIEKENYETKVGLAVQGFQLKWSAHVRETSLKDEAFRCSWTQDAVYSVLASVYVSEGRRRFNVTCHQERLESERLGYYPSNFVFVWKEAIEQGMGGNGSCESLVLKCHSAHVSILGSVPVASHYNATFRYQRVRGEPHLRNRNCDSLMRCFPHGNVYGFVWEKPDRSSINSILNDKNLCKFFCLDGQLNRVGTANGLVCKPKSPEHYRSEEFSKYKCTETIYFMNTVKDVLVFSAILILFLLLLGILKGLIGLFLPRIACWGLDSFFENNKVDKHTEPKSKCRPVLIDKSRAPVHSDTGTKRITLCSRKLQFLLNVVFFLTYPVAACYACTKYFVGSKQRPCRSEESEVRLMNGIAEYPKFIRVSTYGGDRNSKMEEEDTEYVLRELKKSQESLRKVIGQDENEKSVDDAAEKFVNDLLSQRLVFRNLSKPIGDLDIPANVVYSLRGYFMSTEDGGYLFATPCPFKQYWTFLNGEKKSIDPPRVYQSSLFTRIFDSVSDVYESNEVTFIPKGICINVQFPDVK